MNVPKALMAVILRQLATTLKEVSPVLVTVGSQAMDPIAQVHASINLFLDTLNNLSHIHYKSSGMHHISISNLSSKFYDFSLQI